MLFDNKKVNIEILDNKITLYHHNVVKVTRVFLLCLHDIEVIVKNRHSHAHLHEEIYFGLQRCRQHLFTSIFYIFSKPASHCKLAD